jgi:succinyl-CoA synthetase beta subunit
VLCATAEEAAAAARAIGPAMIKAQVATGKRGKAGGIKRADSPEQAERLAAQILSMHIDGHPVGSVLVEARAEIAREFYLAILPDVATRRLMILLSTEGGVDIEEIAAEKPAALHRIMVDIDQPLSADDVAAFVGSLNLAGAQVQLADVIGRLYAAYRQSDAELIEINPLALTRSGRIVALDAKVILDDAALYRHPDLAHAGAAEPLTELERRGLDRQLKYIELDGNIGVLANGAGLTMATMDVIRHFGGKPANFLEIGGEAYTRSAAALDLVLSNPAAMCLVVNFCGAFARTDVMVDGIVQAWKAVRPKVPVFFSVHGTGEVEAVSQIRDELGIEPFDLMEDAIQAAVKVANE